jgi:hypothetical protein
MGEEGEKGGQNKRGRGEPLTTSLVFLNFTESNIEAVVLILRDSDDSLLRNPKSTGCIELI